MQIEKKNGCFPDLDKHLKERGRKLVSYKEGAEIYGISYYSFVRLAKEAGENYTLRKSVVTKANSALTDMPGSPNRNIHRMENIIVKIVDLENEINQDIDMLVDLKTEIMQVIKKVDDLELQTLLEQRYLNFRTWEQIAVDMGYNVRHLYRMHDKALKAVQVSKVVT